MQKKGYYPQLDSIRGLSFLSVFLYHAVSSTAVYTGVGGFLNYIHHHLYLGLDVFFILSSFLLTWLGLKEYQLKQAFSFKNYFARRVLRIWPLYYVILIFAFLILPFVAKRMNIHVSLPPAAWYVFFASNFYMIDHVYFLRFLWTLSVEEQFYLILGSLFKFVVKYLTSIFLLFLLMGIVFSLYNVNHDLPYYHHTITYFFNFAIGGLAAIAYFRKNNIARLLGNLSRRRTFIFYSYFPVHFVVFWLMEGSINSDFLSLINRCLFILYIALLIIEQLVNSSRSDLLQRNRFMVFTGRISFGLYCFHGITLTFANALFPCIDCIPLGLRVFAIFAVNYGIAVISYYYFELPFLRLKEKYRKN